MQSGIRVRNVALDFPEMFRRRPITIDKRLLVFGDNQTTANIFINRLQYLDTIFFQSKQHFL
jgi:hypothetical protein